MRRNADRDADVVRRVAAGERPSDLATVYGISRQRVEQIASGCGQDLTISSATRATLIEAVRACLADGERATSSAVARRIGRRTRTVVRQLAELRREGILEHGPRAGHSSGGYSIAPR